MEVPGEGDGGDEDREAPGVDRVHDEPAAAKGGVVFPPGEKMADGHVIGSIVFCFCFYFYFLIFLFLFFF